MGGYCIAVTMEATWGDTMVDTIPTTVVSSLVARGGRQELSLKLTLRLTHGCCIIATMEATLEDTMVDTIPTIVALPLAVRGGRLPLSLLLTLRLTLGYCIMEDTLDTMEAFMAIPTLLGSKRMPQQMTKPDSFTNMFSKSSKISLFTYY